MKLYTLSFILLASLYSCKSLSQTNLDSTLEDYQQEILGVWIMENHPETKIEFTSNGEINRLYDDILESTDQYVITNTCDGETQTETYFLKTIDSDGSIFCAYIEGLNFEGNNMMSLMTKNQGKIVVYVRP